MKVTKAKGLDPSDLVVAPDLQPAWRAGFQVASLRALPHREQRKLSRNFPRADARTDSAHTLRWWVLHLGFEAALAAAGTAVAQLAFDDTDAIT